MNSLPFVHLNLRRNPFGELTQDERTQLAHVEIHQILEHMKSPRAVVQIVGEKGYGKTTHLLAIRRHFSDSVYVHIPEGERIEIPDDGNPLLIDEAQRLTFNQRWNVLRSGRRLVFGTHYDFTRRLRGAGRPVLTLAADRLTNAACVFEILNTRIQFARRSPGPIPTVTEATASELFAQFGPDLRRIEQSLYYVFQELTDIRDV